MKKRSLNFLTSLLLASLLALGGMVGCSDAINDPAAPALNAASTPLLKGNSCSSKVSKKKKKKKDDKREKEKKKRKKKRDDDRKKDKRKKKRDRDNRSDNGGDTGSDNGGDTGSDTGGDNGGDTGSDNGTTTGSDCTPEYDGCVQPLEYWVCYPNNWPTPFAPDLQFCTATGTTYYTVLSTSWTCPANWWGLAGQQYIGALLNKSYNGGNIPPEVQEAIDDAQLFFHNRDGSAPLTEEELCEAQRLYNILKDFNEGYLGLAPCE